MTRTASDASGSALACVVLAHENGRQVRRLIDALDPFPVFLHCNLHTSAQVFAEMTRDLPSRVTVLPRRRTGWGRWGTVAAELEAIRAAVSGSSATHVAVMTGSDYPVASSAGIQAFLAGIPGISVTDSSPLPNPRWGHQGGRWRLRYRFWSWRKHMLWLPLPRSMPQGVVLAGGPLWILLAREHAVELLRVVEERPDLVRFWRRSWIPEETFVPSLLHTPSLVPGWKQAHRRGTAWFVDWGSTPAKSPRWLTWDHLPDMRRAARQPIDGVPKLFARKFSATRDPQLLDEIDRSLRQGGHPEGCG